MINVILSEEVATACPGLHVALISCSVINTESDTKLWNEISAFEESFRIHNQIEDINKRQTIQATRKAYKALGKDPNRYRPSAEALCRRILRGLPLYKINTLVDLINLISLRTGYSIGGFDQNKIDGTITLGVGRANDLFHGIGRGELNIEGLPVYRDSRGGIGTPTSDEERTKISMETTRLLMIINGYSGEHGLNEAVLLSVDLLKQYVSAQNIEIQILKA